MAFERLGLLGLLVYLGVLVVVAFVARRARRDLSPADHFLAGRGLGLFVVFLTIYATAYSGNTLLGYPGEAYRRGFSWVMATGFMMSILVFFHVLVPRLRPIAFRHGFVTPGDWVRHRFAGEPGARTLRIAVGLAMSIALANFLLAQLMAMGHVTEQVTGGVVPYGLAVVGLATLILFYETLGGMRAVAWTDAAQGTLMLLGLGVLLVWLLGDGGGLGAITAQIASLRPEALAVPSKEERINWASTIVLMGVASIIYPQAIQRIYAARSATSLKRAMAIMTFMPLTTTLVVTLIGWAAIPRFEALGHVEADTVMPRLLGEWAASDPLSAGLAVLVFVGALAAIMSTADSVLLSLGSVLAVDVAGQSGRDPAATRLGKRFAAIVIALAVILALVPRFTLWELIELKMELLIQCAPVFLLALHWPGFRARAGLAGLVVGSSIAVVAALLGESRVGGVHVGVLALLLNLLVAVAGSLLLPSAGASTPGAGAANRPGA